MKLIDNNFRVVQPGILGKLTWLPYETLIALLCLMSGIFTLAAPESEALTRFANITRPLWTVYLVAVLYILSGVTIISGLWRPRLLKLEFLGNIILIVGVLIETAADLIYRTDDAFQANLVFLMVLVCALARIKTVASGQRMIMVSVEGE